MKQNTNFKRSSRRITPWTGDPGATPLQKAIDTWNQDNYDRRHPKALDQSECDWINSIPVDECRHCHSSKIFSRGKTATGIRRYQCKDCGKTFTPITNTIFDSRKIPISQWLDFLFDLFGYSSFHLASKGNRNAATTTKYWTNKVFLTVNEYQEDIILSGTVYIDETFYAERAGDIEEKAPGIKYRGTSRNQICIGIGCDEHGHVICFVEGHGKTSKKRTMAAFGRHIAKGSHLIHDQESSHNILIKELELTHTSYNSKDLKKLKDKDNPLNPINLKCRLLKGFLSAHSSFLREDLQNYLNLFSFIANPPHNKPEKVQEFLILAIKNPKMLRYRG